MPLFTLQSNSAQIAQWLLEKEKYITDAADKTVDDLAQYAVSDLEKTRGNWHHEVNFVVTRPVKGARQIKTSDRVWWYLNKGTSVRRALLSRDWQSKTKPNWLGSGSGSGRVILISKRFNFPGIKARNWQTIVISNTRSRIPAALAVVVGK